jgi:hypothetical protein
MGETGALIAETVAGSLGGLTSGAWYAAAAGRALHGVAAGCARELVGWCRAGLGSRAGVAGLLLIAAASWPGCRGRAARCRAPGTLVSRRRGGSVASGALGAGRPGLLVREREKQGREIGERRERESGEAAVA